MNIRRNLLVLAVVAFASGCSMRVSGMLYDSVTGEIVTKCGITVGPRYYRVGPTGHYDVRAKAEWKKMVFVAPGYETKTVDIDLTKGRFPNMNIAMDPVKEPEQAPPCRAEAKK